MSEINDPNQIINASHKWFADKSAYVKVEEISRTFNVPYGLVRDSMTGPTLFSILRSQLGHIYLIKIKYADYAYFFFEGDEWEEIKIDEEKTVSKIVGWLEKLGMLVNVTKRTLAYLNKKISAKYCQSPVRRYGCFSKYQNTLNHF
jgi:hypothetical protein